MIDQSRLTLLIFTIIIGAGTTFWGLFQMDWSLTSTQVFNSVYRNVGTFIVAAIIVEMLARVLDIGRLTAGLVVILLVAVVTGEVWPLIVNILFATSSYVIGSVILSALKIDDKKVPAHSVFLIGAGAYGTTVGLLAHFPVNYPGLYGLALTIPLVLGWRYVNDLFNVFRNNQLRQNETKWLDIVIVLVVLIHFTVSLMPEVGHDALAVHLFVPNHLSHWHMWGFDVTNYVWAVMPMMGDWIYSYVYMLAGETAARMANVGFIFIVGLLIRDLVLWAGGDERGARFASLLFLATPLVFREVSTLLIESVWTSFVVAGTFYIINLLSSDDEQKNYIPIAGIMLGFALAAKAVTFTILPVLLLLLFFRYRSWLKLDYIHITIYSLILFLAMGLIPYITAWHISGNPVFPFFNEYFKSPYYPAENFSGSPKFEKGVSWDTIYRVTFESGKYLEGRPGAAGFQWLLLFFPAMTLFVSTWHRRGLLLITIGILAIILTFNQTAYLRYVLPSFAILGAAIGTAFSVIYSYNNQYLNKILFSISLLTLCLNVGFFKSATPFGDININALMSNTGRAEYLQRRLPIRNAVKLVNELNGARSPVAVFSSPLTAGLSADALYPNWYNKKFDLMIRKAVDANSIADVLKQYSVDYVILNKNWRNAEVRSLIKMVTNEVLDYGLVSVRILREEYLFNTELLSNTDLSVPDAWQLSKGVVRTDAGIAVSVVSPAAQTVLVTPRRKYLMEISSQCAKEPSKGRIQINWTDINRKFISTNIRVFDCKTSPAKHSMVVISPPNAVNATVYATGHTKIPLVFMKASFRK